jgi:hypothetical protein
MLSVDDAVVAAMSEDGVTVTSEDGVTVTSDDGEAEDGALRTLRDDQAKLDEAWNKRKQSRS